MYALFTRYLMQDRKAYRFISKSGDYTNKWSEVKSYSFFAALWYCMCNWKVKMVDIEMQVIQ